MSKIEIEDRSGVQESAWLPISSSVAEFMARETAWQAEHDELGRQLDRAKGPPLWFVAACSGASIGLSSFLGLWTLCLQAPVFAWLGVSFYRHRAYAKAWAAFKARWP